MSDVPSAYGGMQSSTAVLRKGNDVACMPRHHLPRFNKSSSLDTRLASGHCAGRAQSTYFYRTEILAYVTRPTNEESAWLNEEKTLIG